MKDGFAKELVERERHGSSVKYDTVRHSKKFKHVDEYFGGREGMKLRHKAIGHEKSLNENLNPLWGWLRSCVGKNWDKQYSQLRKQFDARNVINRHILEHLFQAVETHTFIGEKGAVMFMDTRYTNKGEQPISKCHRDYYVCPKTGVLKKTQKVPRRSVVMQEQADKLKAELAVKRTLEDGSELHKGEDGIWYLYTFDWLPKAKVQYIKPLGATVFKTGYQFLGTPNSRREKTWEELNQAERERFGTAVYDVQPVVDLLTGRTIRPSLRNAQRYACTKRSAPHKILRAQKLNGTASANDDIKLSHRKRAALGLSAT